MLKASDEKLKKKLIPDVRSQRNASIHERTYCGMHKHQRWSQTILYEEKHQKKQQIHKQIMF